MRTDRTLSELCAFAAQMLSKVPADDLLDLDEHDRDWLKGKILVHCIQQGTIDDGTIRSYAKTLLIQKKQRPELN